MGYNIDTIEIVHKKDFEVDIAVLEDFRQKLSGNDLPANCIFDYELCETRTVPCAECDGKGTVAAFTHTNKKVEVTCPTCDGKGGQQFGTWDNPTFPWTRDWSGNSLSTLIRLLALFDGELDVILTWEGGDSFTGLRLRDHVVTKHKVVMSLGEESCGQDP